MINTYPVMYSVTAGFFRIMSTSTIAGFTAGALAYTSIANAEENIPSKELKRKFMNTNGPIDINNPVLLFPCRPK